MKNDMKAFLLSVGGLLAVAGSGLLVLWAVLTWDVWNLIVGIRLLVRRVGWSRNYAPLKFSSAPTAVAAQTGEEIYE
jgi:hypothetical protein